VIDQRFALPLLRYGGWMTVSNIVGPLITYLDRFVIGNLAGLAAVAWYVTPHEMLARLSLFADAIIAVMFPVFSASFARSPATAREGYRRTRASLACLMFVGLAVISAGSHEVIATWIDTDFADRSAPVLQLLAMGAFVNVLARVSLSVLQASGRPSIPARLHLAEFPIYVALLIPATLYFGLTGAALATVARNFVDFVALDLFSARCLKLGWLEEMRWFGLVVLGAALLGAVGHIEPFAARWTVIGGCAIVCAWVFAGVFWPRVDAPATSC
jgi:O-antigen/teichoic acid export membrane protein